MRLPCCAASMALALASFVPLSPAQGQATPARSSASTPAVTAASNVRVATVADDLEHPWSLAFLPDGRMLVTERPGRLRIVTRDGKVSSPLAGVPPVWTGGQGGLLDVVLDPQFAENRTIWFSYSEAGEGGAGTAVARAELGGDRIGNVRVVFRQQPKVSGGNHFGSRLAFARDGALFVTLGDRFAYRERAQDLATTLGKVVRIDREGRAPRDNPFVAKQGALPEVWSYGHRNVQSAAIHPVTGALWTVEHGARGGDEINIPQPGRNYGWPVITYGVDYSGAKIGEGTAKPGMEQPIYYWDPSIAPSGMAFYTGDAFPAWKHNLLVGALAGQMLVRLELDGSNVVREERMLRDLRERIRDVRVGPDGLVYLLTGSRNGRLLVVEPGR
jgi:glucose/arabinose dehydrogenase